MEPNGYFNSEIRPILDDEEAIKAGFDPVEDGALEVTRKTREGLAKAPPLKLVWENFTTWVNKFNYRKCNMTAPVPCGYNINGFDLPIVQKMAERFGPVDAEGRQNLFNRIWKLDVMDMAFLMTESNPNIKSRKLTAIMDWLGYPEEHKENAHDALQDVKNTANILIKFLKFNREIAENTKFETAFANGLYIK